MTTKTLSLAMLTVALIGCDAAAGAAEPDWAKVDWAAALKRDARALHDDIAANHPGPVNRVDPTFRTRNDAALALALRRADKVQNYPGYLAAMRGYVARFDDGHLSISAMMDVPVAVRWPGFLTTYDARGRQLVRSRLDDAPVPIGAELVACDGRGAAVLSQQIVGDFHGRWSLASMRGREGFRVFIDNGNPFVKRPTRCTFRIDGRPRTVTLPWRPMPDDQWVRYALSLADTTPPPIVARRLKDGSRWYAMSDFDGAPSGKVAEALRPMIAAMKRDRAAIVGAPRIVLDVRGNGGGSSEWSMQIAAILWGQAAIDALPTSSSFVEWRASTANVATLAAVRTEFEKAPDASDAMKNYFAKAVAGIAAAHAAGRPLWREPSDLYEVSPASSGAPVTPPTAPIYVLTDWSCASACLDAVDLWKSLGAIQVGQETSADTLYMDVRQDVLPGGWLRASVPMKVYRGRSRGSNVPQLPRFRFPGDLRDTAQLETWIAGISTARRGAVVPRPDPFPPTAR